MILKTIKKEKYDIENSTESQTHYVTQYYSDIEYVSHNLPLEHKKGYCETLELNFRNKSSIFLNIRILEANCCNGKSDLVWRNNYKNVFLMNDKGQTIEKIV